MLGIGQDAAEAAMSCRDGGGSMSIVSMRGVRPHVACRSAIAVALTSMLGVLAPAAQAFDFQDGRLQIHGFFEEQIRALSEDFSGIDDTNLAQWYNVLSIETEYDFAPDGFGPFDILSGFARVEVRYDCVWTRGCGMFPSVDGFGDRVATLPNYKTDGRRSGLSGSLSIADQPNPNGLFSNTARFTRVRYEPFLDLRTQSSNNPLNCDLNPDPALRYRCRSIYSHRNGRTPMRLDQVDGFTGLFAVAGSNRTFEANGNVSEPFVDGSFWTARNDDPAYFYFSNQSNCRFGSRRTPGGANGIANQILGPLNMQCRVDATGALVNKPNPFNPGDLNPITVDPNLSGGGRLIGGTGALPGRPASELLQGQQGQRGISQGVFYPSGAFRRFLDSGDASNFDQNFSQAELAFNRGGSQQDEKEFKEGYLDMEFFDSRLWVRAGKQNIVWGKTELFRTTDQFNPVDLALASLPSLEEARIALWSVRGVWSFYDVGPLEDLRLELAANLDDFEPADIGRCGEPFTAMVACNKTTALWAHGLFGVALAGETRPDSWWEDASGLEYGARVEFRAGRFSFQIMDFYGYEDLPYVKRINSFENRKDLNTGRPLKARATGSCVTGFDGACLPLASNLSLGPTDPKSADPLANSGALPPGIGDPETRRTTLENMSANIQIFATICATSIGFSSDTDPAACGQSVFNSQVLLPPVFPPNYADPTSRKTAGTVASLLSNTLAGNNLAKITVQNFFTNGAIVPYVRLNLDPCDFYLSTNDGNCSSTLGRAPTAGFGGGPGPGGQYPLRTLNQVLTDEQESLLGCGPFWGTDCEADGVDLLNAEASVIMQSFPGVEGNYGRTVRDNGLLGYCVGCFDSNGNMMPVPGTYTFDANNPASRWDGRKLVILPGARGPANPGYNPLVDGCVGPGPYGCNVGDVVNGVARTVVPDSLTIPFYDDPAAGVVNGFGPAAGLPFQSEMAALSWNYLLTLVAFSRAPSETNPRQPALDQFDPQNPTSLATGQCSYRQPQYCSSVISFFSISGAQRNSVRAGGSGQFGRRDFQWHAGGEGVLDYQKRNVLGFSTDFAEDFTKSNWGIETTWISNVRFTDNDSMQGVNTADTFNLTVSVDRPTFINFLNPNRTFFFNSQIFMQYINNYQGGFVNNGPFNMLGTFTVQTGYMQDRLLPNVTFVYDVNSNSGAALPGITYRFTESFSATVGVNFFWGRWEYEDMPIAPLGTVGSESGSLAYRDGVENGLSVVRERDEAYLRIRYTF